MHKYEKNSDSLDIVNKEIEDRYFTNGEIIQKIFDAVRKNFAVNDLLFGNYASDIMIIINGGMPEVNIIVEKIKDFYEENNADFYDIYLTTYRKTINEKINKALLQKEIEIINPSKILYFGFDLNHTSVDKPSFALSKTDLDLFISAVEDFNEKEKHEYEQINKKFNVLLKHAVTKDNKINLK